MTKLLRVQSKPAAELRVSLPPHCRLSGPLPCRARAGGGSERPVSWASVQSSRSQPRLLCIIQVVWSSESWTPGLSCLAPPQLPALLQTGLAPGRMLPGWSAGWEGGTRCVRAGLHGPHTVTLTSSGWFWPGASSAVSQAMLPARRASLDRPDWTKCAFFTRCLCWCQC